MIVILKFHRCFIAVSDPPNLFHLWRMSHLVLEIIFLACDHPADSGGPEEVLYALFLGEANSTVLD